MEKNSKIYVAGHRGMVGSANCNAKVTPILLPAHTKSWISAAKKR